MLQFRSTTLSIFSIFIFLVASNVTRAENLRGESGSTQTVATVIMQTTAKDLNDAGHTLNINTNQTLTRSALKLGAGKIDVSIVPPNAWNAMSAGSGPYKKNPDQARELAGNIRSLYSFIAGIFQPIVWGDSGIEEWADVKGKRVFVGPPGGAANKQISGLIRVATGFEPDVDYQAIKMGWGASIAAFQDGQFDVLVFPATAGAAAITQLGLVRPMRVLSLPEEVAKSDSFKSFLEDNGSIPGRIPAGTYKGQINADQDALTISYTMLTAVNKNMSESVAYALTSAFWDNLEENAKTVDQLKSVIGFNPFSGNPMPLHIGAIKYFTEQGLAIPTELEID